MAIDKQPPQSELKEKPEVSDTETGSVDSGRTRNQNGGRLELVENLSDKSVQKAVELSKAVENLKKMGISTLSPEDKHKLEQQQIERDRILQRYLEEKNILKQLEEEDSKPKSDEKDVLNLLQQHYEIIQEIALEATPENSLDTITDTFTGDTPEKLFDPYIPEMAEVRTKLKDSPSYREIEDKHYEGVKLVQDTFLDRAKTTTDHLLFSLLHTTHADDDRLGLDKEILANLSQQFHGEALFGLLANYINDENKHILEESENGYKHALETRDDKHQESIQNSYKTFKKELNELKTSRLVILAEHRNSYVQQRIILHRRINKLNKIWTEDVAKITKDETGQVLHEKFINKIKDIKEQLFRKEGGKIDTPVLGFLEEFDKLTQTKPGEEIISAVRKFLVLVNFDKKRTFRPLFVVTRAVLFGLFKNLKEESGESIRDFQDKLKNWWVRHVNRPKLNENGDLVQKDIVSPVLNSEKGSYFTRSAIKGKSKEAIQNINQTDAVAIFAREQLLSTLQDEKRDQELDILDRWTHSSMPHKEQYVQIIHRGDQFKKIIIKHSDLIDHKKYIISFSKQFDDDEGWLESTLDEEQKAKALSGLTTTQEALTRKFDKDDCTSADTSLVLFKKDSNSNMDDIAQRNTQAWTHGAGIKNSIIMFVGDDGKLTGDVTKKGAHAFADGRVSTLQMEYSLKKAIEYITGDYKDEAAEIDLRIKTNETQVITNLEKINDLRDLLVTAIKKDDLDEIKDILNQIKILEQKNNEIQKRSSIEIRSTDFNELKLNTGSEEDRIDNESEVKIESFQIKRDDYQSRIDHLFKFFKKEHSENKETSFSIDINGITSAAMLMSINQLKNLAKVDGDIEGIHTLERMVNRKDELKIGGTLVDTIAPVPMQFDKEIQNEVREITDLLEKYKDSDTSLEDIAKKEKIPINELRRSLQKMVLVLGFFDIEKRQIKEGKPGAVPTMAEMAGDNIGDIYKFIARSTNKKSFDILEKIPLPRFIKKKINKVAETGVRDILTKTSRIIDEKITKIPSDSMLFSSLVSARAMIEKTASELTTVAFSTARDEVYEQNGITISASSYIDEKGEEIINILLRQREEYLNKGLAEMGNISLQDLVEENMKRILLTLETYQEEFMKEQEGLPNAA